MLDGKGDDLKEPMSDEVGEEIRSRRSLEILRNGCTLVQEMNSVLFALSVSVLGFEYGKQLLEKGGVTLEMLDNVDLVEEYERVENRKGRVVQDACKNNIFQVL